MQTVALCETSVGKVDDTRNGEVESTPEGNSLRLAGKAQAKNGVAEGRSKSLLLHREARSKKMMIEIGKAVRKVEQEAKAAAKAEKKKEKAKADEETMESDHEACAASQFRHTWIAVWSRHHGSFDDITKFRPMRFTFERPPDFTFPMSTLQIFSVKVAGIRRRRGLQWPLDVFGIVAVRDSADFNRNIIFSRTRNNCQTLTKEDPYLVLAGPTRAVVWEDFLCIEVKLTVKGRTESEDKDLSFLAVPFACTTVSSYSYRIERYKTSKRSTLRLSLGYILRSVEATVFMKITKGSWPDCLHGQFDAFTTGICNKSVAGIDHEKIILLDSRAEKMLVNGDGEIVLSRRVVSVETTGKLKIHVKAFEGSESGENAVEDELVITPKEADLSFGRLDVGFCEMEVAVAWSLISYDEYLTC